MLASVTITKSDAVENRQCVGWLDPTLANDEAIGRIPDNHLLTLRLELPFQGREIVEFGKQAFAAWRLMQLATSVSAAQREELYDMVMSLRYLANCLQGVADCHLRKNPTPVPEGTDGRRR